MTPYFLLILFAIIFRYVAIRGKKSETIGVIVGKTDYVNNNNISIFVFFVFLFVLLSCRGLDIGNDTFLYKLFYEEYSRLSFEGIFINNGDKLYVLLNWLISKVTKNYQVFLCVAAAISLFPIYKQYCCDKEYSFFKIILFMNLSVFVMLFSGIRQSIALAVSMIAYDCVKHKRKIMYIILCLIAIGFHHTAFMTFLLYPVFYLRLKKKHLIIIVPTVLLIFRYNAAVFGTLASLAARYFGEKYNVEITSTGSYTMIVLLAALVLLSYVLSDENKMDDEAFGLRNYLLFALILQCFAPLHTLSMRLNYYFLIFVPMAMPKVFKYSKNNYMQLSIQINHFLTIFFLIYYLFTAVKSCSTGISALNIYPYEAFWR